MEQLALGEVPPRTRPTDPETSHQAEASIRPKIRESQLYVLSLFDPRRGPMTDQDLVSLSKLSSSGTRTRRSELVTFGLVEWTGKFATLPSGRRSRLWRAR